MRYPASGGFPEPHVPETPPSSDGMESGGGVGVELPPIPSNVTAGRNLPVFSLHSVPDCLLNTTETSSRGKKSFNYSVITVIREIR